MPKTHVYRVIRSGEVRVNKGRAARRHAPGARRRGARAAGARRRPRPTRAAGAGARVSGASSRTTRCSPSTSRPAWPCTAAAASASASSSSCAGRGPRRVPRTRAPARQGDLGPAADRQEALGAGRAAGPVRAAARRGKTYAALVVGAWPERCKVIDVALHKTLDAAGERHVRVVDADARRRPALDHAGHAWRGAAPTSRCSTSRIKTGRTHQIRVHLAHAGHPIVGDPKYGDFALNRALARGKAVRRPRFERMFLHARRLRFDHPASGEAIELEAPLPAECDRRSSRRWSRRSPRPSELQPHVHVLQAVDPLAVRRTRLRSHNRYSRAHVWRFDGGAEVPRIEFAARRARCRCRTPAAVDPEEAFVASLSSCHMLWFLVAGRRARAERGPLRRPRGRRDGEECRRQGSR